MGSQETTDLLNPSWHEITTYVFIGAAIWSALYGAFLITLACGLSAVATAILSFGASRRQDKSKKE